MFHRFLLLCAVAPALTSTSAAQPIDKDHAAKMAHGLDLFKQHVRPMLTTHCLSCHGGKTTEAELDISDRDRLLKGGNGGAAIVPGDAAKSLLYRLMAHEKKPGMPFEAAKLPDALLKHTAAWIDNGAPYDAPLIKAEDATAWTRRTVTPEAKAHWAYQPLHRGGPSAHPQATNPIDRYLLPALEAKRIQPNPPASPRHLIRRAYFDLLGLPPTPEQVDAFLKDHAADPRAAWSKLIDTLLASPHYGERWARHWLDLARFAESHGFEHDYDRPYAYHYRDFVIQAFNSDLPYDTFVKWQLAGDEIAPDDVEALKATGFLAAGVHSTQITKNEVEKHRYDEMDDMLATTGTAMLGLTIGCARCHDHKFDAIPARDYYNLLATFTTTVRADVPLDVDPKLKSLRDGMRRLGVSPPPTTTKVLISSEGLKAVRLHTQGEDFLPTTHYLRRGDPSQKDGTATPGYLQALTAPGDNRWAKEPPKGSKLSYRRSALADWLTDVEQGAGRLLARVIVNRLWQHHFGRGLVATPSDFGTRGEKPSHPELLDHLANQLIREGWRLKPIHRLIMTSDAYQRNSAMNDAAFNADKENTLLWRQPVRRLEAEIIRDALLSVSGTLDGTMFGKGTLDEASKRRSIYFTMKRSKLIPSLIIFDAPDGTTSVGDRPATTIAPQALHLMNNRQVREYAAGLAKRAVTGDAAESIRNAYRIALCREPDADELKEGTAFVAGQSTRNGGDARLALTDYCQVLMCLNEFVYVE